MRAHSENMQSRLAGLRALNKTFLDAGLRMSAAYDGAVYPMDILATGALNRTLALLSGFCLMIEERNLICAGALLRLQLDTALRFYASFRVDKPHEFALQVLGGTPVSKMKDSAGNRLTDHFLVTCLAADYEWLPRVYRETSGYVHLSEKHLLAPYSPDPDGQDRVVQVRVSAEDKPLPDALYVEAIEAFAASAAVFYRYLDGWIFTKANPAEVQRLKRERGRTL
jgi:hypothetical protein